MKVEFIMLFLFLLLLLFDVRVFLGFIEKNDSFEIGSIDVPDLPSMHVLILTHFFQFGLFALQLISRRCIEPARLALFKLISFAGCKD